MTISILAAMVLASIAPEVKPVAPEEVKIEVMTCAQLKAEGNRQLAIMQNGVDPMGTAIEESGDAIAMAKLGQRQGARSVAMGGLQAIAGLAGNAAGVAGIARSHDAMAMADKATRDAILERGHARDKANEKAENLAGDHFVAITEQYQRRGCAARK